VSSFIDLRVPHSLELLGSLVRTGADFAKREEQLARGINTRRYGAIRKAREAIEKIEDALAGQIATVEAQSAMHAEAVRSACETRAVRIERAQMVGLREIPKRAQNAKERWMGDLQMRQFNADRKKAADEEASKQALADFTAKLDKQRKAIVAVQQQVWRAFFGYRTFVKWLPSKAGGKQEEQSGAQEELYGQLETVLLDVKRQLRAFRKHALAGLFSYLPLPALILLIAAGCAALIYASGGGEGWQVIAGIGAGVAAAFWGIHYLGYSQARKDARKLANGVMEAWRRYDACRTASEARREKERLQILQEHENTSQSVRHNWTLSDSVETEFGEQIRHKIETQGPRAAVRNDELLAVRLERIEAERSAQVDALNADVAARIQRITATRDREVGVVEAGEAAEWGVLEGDWKREVTPIGEAIEAMNGALTAQTPAWTQPFVDSWTPSTTFPTSARFARLEVDLSRPGALPKDPRLALPFGPIASIPLALNFPSMGSLLFETMESGSGPVLGTINNIICRLLCNMPPGKLSFTIIDPVGLGESFAGLMQLADFEEAVINRRIWTQRDQIEDRLGELSEHIEKVIQMYLRNQYATITEYNEQAGSVAEKYHFVVVADFPATFSELAAKRLQSIAASGARCGVFTLIHWDQRQPLPDGFVPEDLRKNSVCIRRERGELVAGREQTEAGAALVFDPAPEPELAVALTQKVGKSSIDSNRVEVPFVQIAPEPAELWKSDTTNELRIAIGRTGATKMQYLAIGKGTRQHALFAGKTGSGKSTLFHVIITNLALACSPEQVEFYLIDFKKGVEFKCYAEKHLPHARVIAIESDREFGLSVLQRIDDELRQRGDMFRALGVQDLAGYRRAGGREPVPRSLLIVDEFQEFFVEDDAIAQAASVLLDRIVRQGRAFGIHVLLGSQTLGGAYSLARATLGQMVIRVALQCNEADAYLIMDDTNAAPRLLSRPGEGIYNDAAGALEGNSPFQVVWLPDGERDEWLDKVHELAVARHDSYPMPIVFEGNAPASVRENALLCAALETVPAVAPHSPRAWLGAPNSIKGPTEAAFHRQSGNNLLIVGQRDEAALAMLGASMLAVAAQHPAGTVKMVFFDGTNPGAADAEFIERIVNAIPHGVTVARGGDVAAALDEIATELKARGTDELSARAPRLFLFIYGIQRFKKLRYEEDFSFSMSGSDAPANTGAQFNDLICEGPSHGMHLVATVDTFNNINRFMSRKALSEFEMRVVFQMSANDSASLIDSPKAGNLGLHRAIFYNEHEGVLETFRPYATPDSEWIRQAAEKLVRRASADAPRELLSAE